MHPDVFYPPRRLLTKRKLTSTRLRILLLGAFILAATTGFLIGSQRAASTRISIENELLTLLRFMAVLKLGAAVTGGILAYWRFGLPVSSGFAAAFIVATALMAAASGLIWPGVAVGAGALLFYVGLFTFLGTALKDAKAWIKPSNRED